MSRYIEVTLLKTKDEGGVSKAAANKKQSIHNGNKDLDSHKLSHQKAWSLKDREGHF